MPLWQCVFPPFWPRLHPTSRPHWRRRPVQASPPSRPAADISTSLRSPLIRAARDSWLSPTRREHGSLFRTTAAGTGGLLLTPCRVTTPYRATFLWHTITKATLSFVILPLTSWGRKSTGDITPRATGYSCGAHSTAV